MATYPNYIPDTNPFRLAGPTEDFRRRLWDFDSSLVVVPSRQGYFYRLAQRRKLQLADNLAFEALREQADSAMLMSHGLVPVTTILATVNWSDPMLFQELHNRSPHRLGGADVVNKMLDEQAANEALQKQLKVNEILDDATRDAWKYYGVLTGTRTSLFSHKTKSESIADPKAPVVKTQTKTSYRPDVQGGFRR